MTKDFLRGKFLLCSKFWPLEYLNFSISRLWVNFYQLSTEVNPLHLFRKQPSFSEQSKPYSSYGVSAQCVDSLSEVQGAHLFQLNFVSLWIKLRAVSSPTQKSVTPPQHSLFSRWLGSRLYGTLIVSQKFRLCLPDQNAGFMSMVHFLSVHFLSSLSRAEALGVPSKCWLNWLTNRILLGPMTEELHLSPVFQISLCDCYRPGGSVVEYSNAERCRAVRNMDVHLASEKRSLTEMVKWVLQPRDKSNNSTRQAWFKGGERPYIRSRERPQKALQGRGTPACPGRQCKCLPAVMLSSRKLQAWLSSSLLCRHQVPRGGWPTGLCRETYTRRIIFPPRNLKVKMLLSFPGL